MNLLNTNVMNTINICRTCISKVFLCRNSNELEVEGTSCKTRSNKIVQRLKSSEAKPKVNLLLVVSSISILCTSIACCRLIEYLLQNVIHPTTLFQRRHVLIVILRACLLSPSCYTYILLLKSIWSRESEPVFTDIDCKLSSADIDKRSPKALIPSYDCRSRYAKFQYDNSHVLNVTINRRHIGRRDRSPSRIPAKKLSRVLNKSRKLRRIVRKYIRRNIPKSSHIHRLLYAFTHERKRLLKDQPSYLREFFRKTKRKHLYSSENVTTSKMLLRSKCSCSTKRCSFRKCAKFSKAKEQCVPLTNVWVTEKML